MLINQAVIETYEDMLSEAADISDRRGRDNLRLGDLLIRACGPAVIGRPSNDNMSILGDFKDVTGFQIRTLQQYRQVAEFYTIAMRGWCKGEHVFYTWMRDAMTKAFREHPEAELIGQRRAALSILKMWLAQKYDTEQVAKDVPAHKGEVLPLSQLHLKPDTLFTVIRREDGKIVLKAVCDAI